MSIIIKFSSRYTKEVIDAHFLETGKRLDCYSTSIAITADEAAVYRKHVMGLQEYVDRPWEVSSHWQAEGDVDSPNPSPEKVYELWCKHATIKQQAQIDHVRAYIDKAEGPYRGGEYSKNPWQILPGEMSQTLLHLPTSELHLATMTEAAEFNKRKDAEFWQWKKAEEAKKEAAEQEAQARREAEKTQRALELAGKPGLDIEGKRASVLVIPTELGATIKKGPVEGGQMWLAKICLDPSSPGGLERDFQPRGKGKFFEQISGLKVGDAVEFGANTYGRKGKKSEDRWYGVVSRVNDSSIEFLGPMTSEQACKFDVARLFEVYGDQLGELPDPDQLERLKLERAKIQQRQVELDTQILALEMRLESSRANV